MIAVGGDGRVWRAFARPEFEKALWEKVILAISNYGRSLIIRGIQFIISIGISKKKVKI